VADHDATITDVHWSEGKRAESSAPLHPLIAARWSPRALDPAAEVSADQMRSLLEAARWAPSFGNTQPARYLVGWRGDDTFRRIHDVLSTGNRPWTENAAVLLLGVAVTENEKGAVPYAEYGVALASQNLVLQAVAEGLVAHQMAGFEPERAREEFALPPEARPVIAIAVGVLGDPTVMDDRRRNRELAPRTRLPLGEVAFTGGWGRPAF
jgi:nitroreductase